MADEEDPSDLFAIPDLWRPSTLDDTLTLGISTLSSNFNNTWNSTGLKRGNFNDATSNTQNPLFALDVGSAQDTPFGLLGASQGLIETSNVQVLGGVENDGHIFFQLPDLLKQLAGQQPEWHTNPPVGHPETELEPEPLGTLDLDDFWLSADDTPRRPAELKTWESFDQPGQYQHPPLFLSEAGPAAFDALLSSKDSAGDTVPDLLDSRVYCACLLNLALGRSSILFSWNPEKNSFVKTAAHLRISGLSLDSVQAVDRLCLDCGNATRHLQAFAEMMYSAASTPTRVALAGLVDRLVTVIRSELGSRSRHVRSMLQLQAVVQPAQSALSYFKGLVKKLAQQKSDEGILSCLFEEAQASEYRSELLREATREVLRILSKPWTDFVEEWLGLKAEDGIPMTKTGRGKSFVRVAPKTWVDDQGFELEEADYLLDEDKVPTFVPSDMAQTIFETGRNLRFLREYHPEHPLSRPDVVSSAMPPKLEWEFDWDAMAKLEARVDQYHKAVSRAIDGILPDSQQQTAPPDAHGPKSSATELEYFGKDEAQMQANILASMRQLDELPKSREPHDTLTRLFHTHLYQTPDTPTTTTLSPHWTLIPLLSFGPAISAQATLINDTCMTLLFTSHHLRAHLDLLKQSFLLTNGLLCSRLTQSLFDPTLSTAERRAGVALTGATMGLRLAGRHTWPPASSELRLALMGVLAECYQPLSTTTTTIPPSLPSRDRDGNTLPGDLSFAIRHLPPAEIEACTDPHALAALDFLRLSYKPPAALRPIFSPAILSKYDRIFRLLLRMLRMLYVVDELFLTSVEEGKNGKGESRAAVRFGWEARLFVGQVAGYFWEVGVESCWGRWEGWLDGLEGGLNVNEGSGGGGDGRIGAGGGSTASPDVVRERLEGVLDEIMGVLLLRKRQAAVLGLLEETFGVVLRFAKGRRVGEGESAEVLYPVFRKKVEVFVTVCRGLGEKMAAGGGAEGGSVEQLLVRLDMTGFYGRGAAV